LAAATASLAFSAFTKSRFICDSSSAVAGLVVALFEHATMVKRLKSAMEVAKKVVFFIVLKFKVGYKVMKRIMVGVMGSHLFFR
jgi:hypothetical protein